MNNLTSVESIRVPATVRLLQTMLGGMGARPTKPGVSGVHTT